MHRRNFMARAGGTVAGLPPSASAQLGSLPTIRFVQCATLGIFEIGGSGGYDELTGYGGIEKFKLFGAMLEQAAMAA